MHTPPTGRSPTRPDDYTRHGAREQTQQRPPADPNAADRRLRAGTAAEHRARPCRAATQIPPPPTGCPGQLPIAADDRSELSSGGLGRSRQMIHDPRDPVPRAQRAAPSRHQRALEPGTHPSLTTPRPTTIRSRSRRNLPNTHAPPVLKRAAADGLGAHADERKGARASRQPAPENRTSRMQSPS